ncbi:MAG: polysaccharide biosynthesis/export family protein [Candidatus Amulumruptor caecigallinarius]|nr:polysaccharide biosynthesis/export family protein [Candidatus Amulumruptor caecigallinarius]MCM1396260.1 polysaccharide biosynthesis/export family protein [Candidatus Amulumruptor caecigallinarius]MCM1454254.1 polysaccharide biosynthesis/export family protein [bacterium]
MNRFHLIALLILLTVTGCASKQRSSLSYFENIDSISHVSIPAGDFNVQIEPDDELFISVNSLVPDATAPYNLPLSNPASVGSLKLTEQPRQTTYKVTEEGYITMPVLGKLYVKGLTTVELADKLTKLISKDVQDPVVKVELLNFRVNVLGEVNHPGSRTITRERYSVLDAIADAGDLTPYGERDRVILIREENGKRTYHTFNLNDVSTLTSPYFYLQQNDVIYVEPNAIRKENARYNQYSAYKISVISTVVSAVSVIASLVIALTVK